MNGFAKLAMIGAALCGFGAAALHADEGTSADRPERRPAMRERGERGGRGGSHNYSMLVCPNCHHHLLVLSAPGPGGRGGREGRGFGEGRNGDRPRFDRPRSGRRPGAMRPARSSTSATD